MSTAGKAPRPGLFRRVAETDSDQFEAAANPCASGVPWGRLPGRTPASRRAGAIAAANGATLIGPDTLNRWSARTASGTREAPRRMGCSRQQPPLPLSAGWPSPEITIPGDARRGIDCNLESGAMPLRHRLGVGLSCSGAAEGCLKFGAGAGSACQRRVAFGMTPCFAGAAPLAASRRVASRLTSRPGSLHTAEARRQPMPQSPPPPFAG